MILKKLFYIIYERIIVKIPIAQSLYNFFFRLFFYNSIKVKSLKLGFCPLCGKNTIMLIEKNNLRETGFCLFCSATSRYKAVAELLKRIIIIKLYLNELDINTLKNLLKKINLTQYSLKDIIKSIKSNNFWIYEPSSIGATYNALKKYPKFIFSEYFPYPNLKLGQYIGNTRFEDLQSLTFRDNSFDLIISLDVFEHIKDPQLAFREIYRVLKPKGILIFTVPLENRKKTIQRIDKNDNVLVKPVIFHSDNVRSEGPIVYNDFGYDIIELLKNFKFSSFIFSINDPKIGIFCKIEVIVSMKK